ncbi:MAG: DNA internalization-related competence protein ComEC/Rec2 [Gammaproteobacteria bacterium]|nr:DNA internalization-related competence protein ComEC/Rec2 [Gammaproteobacteria bacterium]
MPQNLKRYIFYALIFVCGFYWALIYTHWVTAWSLPRELESKNLLITGYIAAPPISKSRWVSFNFKTKTIAGEEKHTKLKLSWYGDSPKINAGDKWQLLVRLKRPHGMLNPGGFDVEKHLLMHHIRATGYVVNSDANQVLSSSVYNYPLSRLRQFLIQKMDQALISDPLAPLIIAFVTGFEDRITQSQWQVMRDTGTSYLVAISGLHVGLVASIVFVFAQFLWRFSSRLTLLLPAREAGIIIGLFIGLLYSAVSGLSIPTQRALVMLLMFSLVVLFRRYSKSWNAWLWSLFLVLVINPLAVLTIGFWLSFCAVAAIIYVGSGRIKQNRSRLRKFWRMQFTVTLALLPLTLLFFQQLSLVTFLANLIAMPGVCLIIIPMSLLGALCLLLIPGSIGGWILWCGAKLLGIIWWWLTFLANFFNCSWYHPIYNSWVLVATSVGVIILLAPRGFPARYLGLLYLLPLFFYEPPSPKENNEVWFTLLDVGQGLAAVVQTKNHVLLYDTGPKFFEYDAGASIIVPYLRKTGVKTINAMVVSHGDSDHSGGAISILKAHSVDMVITSVPENFIAYKANSCFAGQHWQWDGVDFQMLSPAKDASFSGNNASCVLKISSGKNSILLPGDIERAAEGSLIKNYELGLNSTILVAPHHGSATSSTDGLIAAVKPQYVIFPVGYRNRFRFPHKKVITRYMKSNAILLNASQTGAITFKFTDKSDILGANFYREEAKRFWHDR